MMKKMLISLWAENIDRINSNQARKAWEDIATQMNKKFGSKRATESCRKKMKYLLERYKVCKDWNSKQTGGNLRKSAHFDEIDGVMGCRHIVTLSNVKEAGSAVSQDEEPSSSEGGCVQKKEARRGREKRKMITRRERCFGPPFQDWKPSEVIWTLSWLILQGCKSNRSQRWMLWSAR